jgi:hypothetical protein
LNDPSETRYAISRACELITNGTARLTHLSPEVVSAFLAGKESPHGVPQRDFRAYVVSFCSSADKAIHWLHYGKSGTGVAIGFEARSVQVEQFDLYRVLYDQESQDNLLLSMFSAVDRFVGEWIDRMIPSAREFLLHGAAHLFAGHLRLAASQMKNPAFEAEEEWRLIATESWFEGPAEHLTRPTHFRSPAGLRVVPYKKLIYQNLPITELVLGASSQMEVDDQSIAVLMEATLEKHLPVTRSTVTIRP